MIAFIINTPLISVYFNIPHKKSHLLVEELLHPFFERCKQAEIRHHSILECAHLTNEVVMKPL